MDKNNQITQRIGVDVTALLTASLVVVGCDFKYIHRKEVVDISVGA